MKLLFLDVYKYILHIVAYCIQNIFLTIHIDVHIHCNESTKWIHCFEIFVYLTIRSVSIDSNRYTLRVNRVKLKSRNKRRRTRRTDGWTVSWPGELEHATPERESKTTNQGIELG